MWEIIAIPIAVTLVIETLQIVYGIGAFELTDIIANSMGGNDRDSRMLWIGADCYEDI